MRARNWRRDREGNILGEFSGGGRYMEEEPRRKIGYKALEE
jgi:hypothetical protein